jgi:hypothetical protein
MIVYGQARVGGVIAFANSAGTEQRELYIAVVHTGHEIEEYVGWFIDDKYIDAVDVDTAGDGSVDGDTASTGHGLVPFSATPVCYLRGYLGTAGQTVDTELDTAFTEWTSNHRFRGCAYTVLRADLIEGAEDRWDGAAPNNVSAVVKGKKVYDPRLDSTFTGAVFGSGSGAHRLNTPSTWEWSDNPALCTADYMIDSDLGPAWATARIDYDSVAVAAEHCDELVDVPTAATQKRFTCNGVLSTSSTHRENLEMLLSSMLGNLRYFGGQWHVYANMYEAPVMAFDEGDLIGPVSFKAEPDRDDRYNLVKGSYVDPDREYKLSPFIEVSSALKSSRDNNRELTKELSLPLVNNEYQAQRCAFMVAQQAGNTGIVVLQIGYQALNLRVGDLFTVTHVELGWSDKVFRVVRFKHVDFQGVELVGKEDSEAAYDDPEEGDYGTRTAAGEITFPRISPAQIDTPWIAPGSVDDPYLIEEFGTEFADDGTNFGPWEDSVNVALVRDATVTIVARANSISGGTAPTWTPFVGAQDGQPIGPGTDVITNGTFFVTGGTYDIGMRLEEPTNTDASINDRLIEIFVIYA